MDDEKLLPPPVLWAQRKNLLYVRIQLEDCKSPTIQLENDKLYFRGSGGTENKEHEVTLEFYGEIKAEESKYSVKDRAIEFVLTKCEDGYWRRLLREDRKLHWLKVDFNKWKDEEDSEEEVEGADFEEMMRKMGGLSDSGVSYDGEDADDEDGDQPDSDDD